MTKRARSSVSGVPPLALTVTIELPPLHRIGLYGRAGCHRAGLGDVASRSRRAAIGIGHRVGIRARSMAKRTRATVRRCRRWRSPSLLYCHRCTDRIVGELAVTALGWVMSPVVVAVQPLASVTV